MSQKSGTTTAQLLTLHSLRGPRMNPDRAPGRDPRRFKTFLCRGVEVLLRMRYPGRLLTPPAFHMVIKTKGLPTSLETPPPGLNPEGGRGLKGLDIGAMGDQALCT